MRSSFLILLSFISLTAFGQADSLGFTNKAEAKNLMINGKKEGKWCEYINFNDVLTTVPHEPDQGYQLTIYKAGAPIGLVKQFYTSGKLWDIVYYVNGQRSGIEKMYYESGELKSEITNADGVPLIIKDFYKNGKLKSEQIFSLGKSSTKHYDESGNEIKQ